MLGCKFFQNYFSNVFVSIVQKDLQWIVYAKVFKNSRLRKEFSKSFDIYDNLSIEMEEYLTELQNEYKFSYIALFLNSDNQGAIDGVKKDRFEKHGLDVNDITYFDIENRWSVYSSNEDMNFASGLFEKVGLDFIYSPFIVQYELIRKEKPKDKPTLYLLHHDNYITISIFHNSHLLLGRCFKIDADDQYDDEDMTEEEGVKSIIEFDDFSDEEFINFKDVEVVSRDMSIYRYLESTLNEFYKDPLYNSSFIDTIVVSDDCEISLELAQMIENELFMDIEMYEVNMSAIVCDISREEV